MEERGREGEGGWRGREGVARRKEGAREGRDGEGGGNMTNSIHYLIIQSHTFPVSHAVLLPVTNTCVPVPPAGVTPVS